MIIALLGALVIGLSLGLLGSGGSILTVPSLVYFLNRPEKLAIAESLAIVGSVAFAGSLTYALRGQIDRRSLVYFGLPGMAGSYLGAGGSVHVSGNTQMILFGVLMIAVAWTMLRGGSRLKSWMPVDCPLWLMMLQGFAVGSFTGLIGAGGGFLIVPVLAIFNRLPMEKAVGTSLMIIAANAFTGFFKQEMILQSDPVGVDWSIIFLFSSIGIVGCVLGGIYAKYVPRIYLKKAFGVSVLLIGVFILFQKGEAALFGN